MVEGSPINKDTYIDFSLLKPKYVPIALEILVWVEPDYIRSEITQRIFEKFSNKVLSDGRKGFFHRDNFGFGVDVFLGQVVAQGQEIPGVKKIKVRTFKRFNDPETDEGPKIALGIDWYEMARLDNDPNHPENGIFKVEVIGG